jgi:serine-type D-Ala-D-Ala carboxypeptidase (penicillin-binding protein 5/6)
VTRPPASPLRLLRSLAAPTPTVGGEAAPVRPTRRAASRRTAAFVLPLAFCASLPAAGLSQAAAPAVDAKAAIVVDARTGETLHARRADARLPIASTTKLMTALLLLERARPSDVFTAASYRASPTESQIGLRPGERVRVRDLLTALLLESANDAAVTIARNVSGSRRAFVAYMNRRARELGLASTTYGNPVGFDSPRNRSTARDLAVLSRRLLRVPLFARTVDRPRARLRSGARRRTVRNRNTLVAAHSFVDGVKTGHTLGASYVLIGSASRRGARVLSVVLGAPSEAARNAGSLTLLRWGLSRYERRRLVAPERTVARRPVAGRDSQVALVAPRALTATVRRDRRPAVRVRAAGEVEGPLPAGRRVGRVEVVDGRSVIVSSPLVTAAAVPAPSLLGRVDGRLAAVAGLTLLGLLAIVSGAAVLRSRRRRGRATVEAR